MGKLYDKNADSAHGPWGTIEAKHHGPYGNKDNQHQATIQFKGEKEVKPVEKPDRLK
jgi:hypothetical protein